MAQQIKKKYIENGAVDGSKIKLLSGQSIVGTDSLGNDVDLIKLGASDEIIVNGQEVAIKSVVEDLITSEVSDAVAAEEVRAIAAETTLQDNIDSEAATRAAADITLQNNIDAEESRALAAEGVLQDNIDDEVARATAAEASLQSAISAEVTRATAAEAALQSAIDDIEYVLPHKADQADLDIEIATRESADDALYQQILDEADARIAADTTLQSNIDATLVSANDYTDTKVAQLVDSAPETLDTLRELAAALGDDPNFATTVTTMIGQNADAISDEVARATAAEVTLQSNIEAEATARAAGDSALQTAINEEATARIAADSALDVRISSLEADGVLFNKMVITVTTELGFIDLDHQAKENSIVVHQGRLGVHKDYDFFVSVVGGVTRLTFINSLADGGDEAVESGDKFFVTYAY
jgi:hypothetical protein